MPLSAKVTSLPRVIRRFAAATQVCRKANGGTPLGGSLEPLFHSAMPTTELNCAEPWQWFLALPASGIRVYELPGAVNIDLARETDRSVKL